EPGCLREEAGQVLARLVERAGALPVAEVHVEAVTGVVIARSHEVVDRHRARPRERRPDEAQRLNREGQRTGAPTVVEVRRWGAAPVGRGAGAAWWVRSRHARHGMRRPVWSVRLG